MCYFVCLRPMTVSCLLPSKPLPSSSPPTSAPTIGFCSTCIYFPGGLRQFTTLYNGCFLTFTGRLFLMTHGLDPCFPHAIALPWLCSCLLPSLFTVLQPFKLILLILRFSLFKIMSIICKQTLANKLWEYSSILKESLFENLRMIVTLNWSMNSWSVYLCVLNTSSSKHGTTVTYPVEWITCSVWFRKFLRLFKLVLFTWDPPLWEQNWKRLKILFLSIASNFWVGSLFQNHREMPTFPYGPLRVLMLVFSVWGFIPWILHSKVSKSYPETQASHPCSEPSHRGELGPEPSGEPEERLNPLKRMRSREKGRMITFPAT